MLDTKHYFVNICDLCDGDLNLVLELCAVMHRLFAEEMKYADACVRDGDFDTLAKIAHKLRSAVVNFEMDTAVSLLSRLEQISKMEDAQRAEDFTEAKRVIALLKTEAEQFEYAFQRLRSTADESL